jgi:hypothetical protein
MTEMTFHDVAKLFPLMEGEAFEQLKADIRASGLREPIWIYQGKIIDGRNRLRACHELGLTPATREWDGIGSLVEFVVSLNLHRRHLDSGQRATVAVDILPLLEAEAKERQRQAGGDKRAAEAELSPALPQKVGEAPPDELDEGQGLILQFSGKKKHAGEAAAQAAKLTGTNRQYVAEAKKLKEESPDLFEEVKSGRVKLKEAKKKRRRLKRPPLYDALDEATKAILGEHEVGYDRRVIADLHWLNPEERQAVARLLVDGKAKSVPKARKILHPPPSPLEKIKALLPKLTPEERDELRALLASES